MRKFRSLAHMSRGIFLPMHCGTWKLLLFLHFSLRPRHFIFYDWSLASVTLEIPEHVWSGWQTRNEVAISHLDSIRECATVSMSESIHSHCDCIASWWVLINVKRNEFLILVGHCLRDDFPLSCRSAPIGRLHTKTYFIRATFLILMHRQRREANKNIASTFIYQSNRIVHWRCCLVWGASGFLPSRESSERKS